jgi:hypothetical protein
VTVSRPQRYFDPTQPQTLQIAVFLLYFDAVMLVLRGGVFSPAGLLFIGLSAGGGWGIANGKKLGYYAGVTVAGLGLIVPLAYSDIDTMVRYSPVSLMFAIALVCLLLHPHSRQYARIWFS